MWGLFPPYSLFSPRERKCERSEREACSGGGWGLRAKRARINLFVSIHLDPHSNPVKSSFCAGVQFSREPIHASNDRKYEKILEGCEQSSHCTSKFSQLNFSYLTVSINLFIFPEFSH